MDKLPYYEYIIDEDRYKNKYGKEMIELRMADDEELRSRIRENPHFKTFRCEKKECDTCALKKELYTICHDGLIIPYSVTTIEIDGVEYERIYEWIPTIDQWKTYVYEVIGGM